MATMNTVSARMPGPGCTASTETHDRSRIRRALFLAAGIAIVLATALVVGLGPFLRGLAAISPLSVLAAAATAFVATGAASWRWRVVASGYGLALTWRAAVAGYYRSQFLNAVLPAGVLGDVHRAWAHGRAQDRLGGAARAVAVERGLGQAVQIALTGAILVPLGFGSPLVPLVWWTGALTALIALGVLIAVVLPRPRRVLRREYALLRPILARPSALAVIVVASVVVVAAHVTLFTVAAVAVGLPFGAGLAAAGLVVLAAAAIPVNVGGWGPREAAAAAAFALAGLGASSGVAASTAFGVLALIAVAPGAVVLLVERRRPT